MLDEVLITTRSGKPFPLHSEDWKFKYGWFDTLSNAVINGCKICIVDNQFNAGSTGFISDALFNIKIENICKILEKDLSLPNNSIITNFAFDENDPFRCVPYPELLYEVAIDYSIILKDSLLIGNSEVHEQFAMYAGVGTYYDVNQIF